MDFCLAWLCFCQNEICCTLEAEGRDNGFKTGSNRGSGNLSTGLWRGERTGEVLSAMGEGGTVASLSLLGIKFQERHLFCFFGANILSNMLFAVY